MLDCLLIEFAYRQLTTAFYNQSQLYFHNFHYGIDSEISRKYQVDQGISKLKIIGTKKCKYLGGTQKVLF